MSASIYPFQNPDLPLDDRVNNLLSLLSLEEKISLLYDLSPGIPRLGIPKYYHGNECLHGVVRPGRATVFPQAIAFAATWDPDLIYQVATAISDEARAKHHAVKEYPGTYNGLLTFWSPNVNVAIDPRWGRTPETYGEDPYLTGRIGVQFVKGLQGNHPKYLKVVSTPKHFVANNEEHNRFKLKPKISEKWLRDYFLPGFEPLITEAKAASIMGAYNAVFDIPCCHSKWLLTEVLRNEWGFQGYAVTDCGGVAHAMPYAHNYVTTPNQAAASSINAGIDLECGPIFSKGFLLRAVKKNMVSLERIEYAARNVLRARFRLGMFDPSSDNPYAQIPFNVVGSPKHSQLALKTAEESIVLLKNAIVNGKKLLPLDKSKIKSIAVVGPNADVAQFGDYSGIPFNAPITPLMGLRSKLKDTEIKINFVPWIPFAATKKFVTVPSKNLRPKEACEKMYGLMRYYYPNQNFKGEPKKYIDELVDANYRSETADPTISNAQTSKDSDEKIADKFSVKWTGMLCPDITGRYKLFVNSHGTSKWKRAKVKVGNNNLETRLECDLEAGKRYPIEVHFPYAGLGSRIELLWQLPTYHPSESRLNFDREIEAAKSSELVLCFSGLSWGDEHEGIDRHTFDLSSEQQQLIKALYAQNPNMILILVAGSNLSINWEDRTLPAILHAWYPGERGGDAIANVLFGDYNPAGRLPLTFYKSTDQIPAFNEYDLAKGKTYWFLKDRPLYPFGYGLSYSIYEYQNLQVDKSTVSAKDTIRVRVSVKNTSVIPGEDVVQVYSRYINSDPNIPLKQLRAFKRVAIPGRDSTEVLFNISISDFKYWDGEIKKYRVKSGEIELMVGSSSADLPLNTKFIIE